MGPHIRSSVFRIGLLWLALGALALTTIAVAVAPSSAEAWTGYAARIGNSALIPFDTDTGTAETPILFDKNPRGIAITPDGKTALVLARIPDRVIPVDLATGTLKTAIQMPRQVDRIAITPDGSRAYAVAINSGVIYPIDLKTLTLGTPIDVLGQAWDIAISPDGQNAWVSTGFDPGVPGSTDGVTVINLSSGTQTAVPMPISASTRGIAISPDGSRVYAVRSGTNELAIIDTATATLAKTISGGFQPGQIAVTPDGTRAYITNFSSDKVAVIDLTIEATLPSIPVGDYPADVAVTPDSRTVWVTNANSQNIVPVDVATGTAGTPIAVGTELESIAITPDRPPAAALTVSANPVLVGKTVSLDASATAATDLPVAPRYQWDFGDGKTLETSEPTVDHSYPNEGSYQASVTTEDTIGCSLTPVFTGHTASCGGGTSAQATQTITVTTDPCLAKPQAPGCSSDPCKVDPNAPGCSPDPCKADPKAPGCLPTPQSAALGKVKVKPRLLKIRRNGKATFKVTVRNTGDAAAVGLRACVNAPKRLVKLKRCTNPSKLAPGATAKLKIKLKLKPKARRRSKIRLKIKVSARGVKAQRATATIKVR